MTSRTADPWPAGTLMSELDTATGRELLVLSPATPRRAGHVLIRQGDPEDEHVFLLRPAPGGRDALVKVTIDLENGEQVLLGIRVSGDLVGELAPLCDRPRSATVTVCSHCLVHAIPKDTFAAFLRRHPAAWRAVTRQMAGRLGWANRRRADLGGYDVLTRLVRVLAELSERHGHPVTEGRDLGVPLTQEELGRLIGARKDAAGNAMRTLRDAGVAKNAYGRVIILDVARLRRMAGSWE
ncbi:Crp/Fnr family transcriptional regulator [Nonomuraea gerenzanensis]|uniref:Transcriptional regulator with cyclic nucleotide-binding domain n=1 Tax=Nonomuraea gerenzanensis TaxID=93944 RepID=A0A1M4EMC6_9ACTN|nr:Crp/Fnr family transcriptional regulator [Nonomuraea gerenzanensis]UBU11488.1 Crp/Fnr family transcriptional regulator [Nonomuraea gerenzanensis]SBO99974.1 transcriptional regulator with cyclic nucleotide-binding domain [Nonomuraea gerenzanensis]